MLPRFYVIKITIIIHIHTVYTYRKYFVLYYIVLKHTTVQKFGGSKIFVQKLILLFRNDALN